MSDADEIEHLLGLIREIEEMRIRTKGYRYTPKEIGMLNAECDRLRELLRHADAVVIWENTLARPGFQEEIEAALGIGHTSVTESEP